jgi:hypothetical protein
MMSYPSACGRRCAETGHFGAEVVVLAPIRGFRVECRVEPGVWRTSRPGYGGSIIRSMEMEVIPDSFVLITIVLAIPVVGLVAALVASRIPSRRSDS